MSKKISEPTQLSNLEEKILETLKNGHSDYISTLHNHLNGNITECPLCHQIITKDYGDLLLKSIKTVLNKEVEEHQYQLQNQLTNLKDITFNSSLFYSLDKNLCYDIELKIKQCNDLIGKYKNNIMEKLENLHTPIIIVKNDLFKNINELKQLFNRLNTNINKYNCMCNEVLKLKDTLININNSIAYYNIKQYYEEYDKNSHNIDNINQDILITKNNISELKTTIDDLEQKKNNTKIPIKLINDGLQYIFFSENRLKLEPSNGKYILKSRNKSVKPNNISCGERNILALCYYFTEILKKQDINNLYNSEMLLIIDDPISSFDMENKIGIQSYLKQQFSKVLDGNKSSKIIVLSHDISTILDLIKSSKEILSNIFNVNLNNKSLDKKLYIGLLEDIRIEKKGSYYIENNFNEYTTNIELIYNYATKNIDSQNNYIGNIMRRVLEAFSTFEYKKGIEEISTNTQIISILDEKQDYFSNLMYRIVVNNLSHSKYQVQACNLNFYSFLSEEEKIKTAQNVLCLIYGLNKNHLKAHLQNIPYAIDIIGKWFEKIPLSSDISSL